MWAAVSDGLSSVHSSFDSLRAPAPPASADALLLAKHDGVQPLIPYSSTTQMPHCPKPVPPSGSGSRQVPSSPSSNACLTAGGARTHTQARSSSGGFSGRRGNQGGRSAVAGTSSGAPFAQSNSGDGGGHTNGGESFGGSIPCGDDQRAPVLVGGGSGGNGSGSLSMAQWHHAIKLQPGAPVHLDGQRGVVRRANALRETYAVHLLDEQRTVEVPFDSEALCADVGGTTAKGTVTQRGAVTQPGPGNQHGAARSLLSSSAAASPGRLRSECFSSVRCMM